MTEQETMRDNILEGTFVETAFTLEQIERTIAEEERLGIRNDPCAFLSDVAIDAVSALHKQAPAESGHHD